MERETVLAGRAWAIDLEGGTVEDVAARSRALAGLAAPVVLLAGAGELPRWGELLPIAVDRLDVRTRREVLGVALRRAGGAVGGHRSFRPRRRPIWRPTTTARSPEHIAAATRWELGKTSRIAVPLTRPATPLR